MNTKEKKHLFFPSFFRIHICSCFFFSFSKHIFATKKQKPLHLMTVHRNISVQNIYNLCNG